jgi:hypothetical protein
MQLLNIINSKASLFMFLHCIVIPLRRYALYRKPERTSFSSFTFNPYFTLKVEITEMFCAQINNNRTYSGCIKRLRDGLMKKAQKQAIAIAYDKSKKN